MNSDKILSISNLIAGYGETEILHNVSIEVHKNEIVSIIGPNGAGKSTILKAILGTLDIKSGEVFLLEKKITGIKISLITFMRYTHLKESNYTMLKKHHLLRVGPQQLGASANLGCTCDLPSRYIC